MPCPYKKFIKSFAGCLFRNPEQVCREVALARVGQQHHDRFSFSKAFGSLERGVERGSGRYAGEDPFLFREAPRRGPGFLIGDGDDIVVYFRVENVGHESRADSLDAVLSFFALREHGRGTDWAGDRSSEPLPQRTPAGICPHTRRGPAASPWACLPPTNKSQPLPEDSAVFRLPPPSANTRPSCSRRQANIELTCLAAECLREVLARGLPERSDSCKTRDNSQIWSNDLL